MKAGEAIGKLALVAAGAASDVPARTIFRDRVLGTTMSCWLFD